MQNIENILKTFDFDLLGQGQHKIEPEKLFDDPRGFLVDLRTQQEYDMVNFPLAGNSLHIPLQQLPDRWQEIPNDRPVGLLCATCVRSSMAYLYLRAQGLDNVFVFTLGCTGIVEAMKTDKIWQRRKVSEQIR